MVEPKSKLSRKIHSIGAQLVNSAQRQVVDYKARFERLEGVFDKFLHRLLYSYPELKVDVNFIDSFFGKRRLRFVAIDGTVCKKDIFELIAFFAGAYYSEGEVIVNDDGTIKVVYDESYLEKGAGISSILPVFINEVLFIDQTIRVRDEEGEIDPSVSYADQFIIDNSEFGEYLMGLAEFYLAYRLVTQKPSVDILFLDRVASSEVSIFYPETAPIRINLEQECGLIGKKVRGRPFTKTDWDYARRLFGNMSMNTPPPRGEFILARIIMELIEHGPMTQSEIKEHLRITGAASDIYLDRVLSEGLKSHDGIGPVLVRDKKHYKVKPELRDLKERVRELLEDVCGKIFNPDGKVRYDERFKVGDRWLTTNDLAFLSLMALYLTAEACWKNKTLLIGIAKDTSARDLKRQVLPVLNFVGRFSGTFPIGELDVPDTDRMILQWVSLKERDKLKVPWATCEYDTAFKTIIPHLEKRKNLISGARRNQISLNRTFLKAYFQLAEAKSDSKLRSNVLLYDRLAYPEFDTSPDKTLVLKHDYIEGMEPEPVEVILYEGVPNPIQQFIITLFRHMTSRSVPEEFGHLKPLFNADKVAKYHYDQAMVMINSTTAWLATRPELREILFYLDTFRERRAEHERTRKYT